MPPVAQTHPQAPPRDTWIFWGLLALLCWAPLPLGSNRLWAIGILFVWVLILVGGCAYVWRRIPQAALERLGHFTAPLLLLGVMVILSWAQTIELPAELVASLSPEAVNVQPDVGALPLSLDIFQSRVMGTLSFTYFCAFLVAVLTVRSARRLEKLAQVLVWSGVFQAALGAVLFSIGAHYWIFHVEVTHTRIIGTYVYHNSAAGYLSMCLSIGIGLMLARLGQGSVWPADWKKRLTVIFRFLLSPKMRLRILLVVMVIGLVLTRSRMGNAAFFASLMIVGIATYLLSDRARTAMIGLIVSLVIIDIAVIGGWVGLEKVVQRIEDTELTITAKREVGARAESVEERTQAARDALGIVADFPVTGTGGGSFYSSFLRYRTPGAGYIDHAHNDFVEIAGDYGIGGLAALGTLVALALWTAFHVLLRRKSDLPRGIAFGVAMAITALLIHSTVDFNLQIPANALTIVVILAMAWIARELPSRRKPDNGEAALS